MLVQRGQHGSVAMLALAGGFWGDGNTCTRVGTELPGATPAEKARGVAVVAEAGGVSGRLRAECGI